MRPGFLVTISHRSAKAKNVPSRPMARNLDVDLERDLTADEIPHPSAASIHERPRRGSVGWGRLTNKCRPIATCLVSKTGMPVVS